MNTVCIMGRLTKKPETRFSAGETPIAITRYTLAVDRHDKNRTTDFVPCVAFGRSAEFAEKYFAKGMRVAVTGQIQTGSFVGKDGSRVYTWNVAVDRQDFADANTVKEQPDVKEADEGFLDVPDGIEEELPFIG